MDEGGASECLQVGSQLFLIGQKIKSGLSPPTSNSLSGKKALGQSSRTLPIFTYGH